MKINVKNVNILVNLLVGGAMYNKNKSNWCISLGEILKDTIESYNFTIEEFAIKADIPYEHLKNIIENKEIITTEIAEKFEKVINTSSFWINLQNNYFLENIIKQKTKIFKCYYCNSIYYKKDIEKMDIQYCEKCNKIMYSINDKNETGECE